MMRESNYGNLKILSLFSGAMGLDLGLEYAGIPTVACCEIDKWCCSTIRQNKPEVTIFQESVSELDPHAVIKESKLKDPFILVGGPPCQSFSTGGNRAVSCSP